ncbi:hypothetical protein G9A89_000278 [Geosiphon pyriformis]|nr:hypothetical protein G9A89_000278 [Geosiphon pyriformis]
MDMVSFGQVNLNLLGTLGISHPMGSGTGQDFWYHSTLGYGLVDFWVDIGTTHMAILEALQGLGSYLLDLGIPPPLPYGENLLLYPPPAHPLVYGIGLPGWGGPADLAPALYILGYHPPMLGIWYHCHMVAQLGGRFWGGWLVPYPIGLSSWVYTQGSILWTTYPMGYIGGGIWCMWGGEVDPTTHGGSDIGYAYNWVFCGILFCNTCKHLCVESGDTGPSNYFMAPLGTTQSGLREIGRLGYGESLVYPVWYLLGWRGRDLATFLYLCGYPIYGIWLLALWYPIWDRYTPPGLLSGI